MLWTVVGILLLIVLIPIAWRVVSAPFRGEGGGQLLAALVLLAIVFACNFQP